MEDKGLADGLRGLYQDLSSLSTLSLLNVERLCVELETQIEDFRRLLDKRTKTNASRQAVLSGKCHVGHRSRTYGCFSYVYCADLCDGI